MSSAASRTRAAVRLPAWRRAALTSLGELGRVFGGMSTASLDPDRLRHAAEQRSGSSAWGDPSIHRFLERTTHELSQNGNLSAFGRLALGSNLEHHLTNRLRLVAAEGTQASATILRPPIFVTGLYRSGTTYLHRLLSELPGLEALPYWQLRRPVAKNPREARKNLVAARRERRIHRLIEPRFESAHPIAADGPEECLFLMENACAGTMAFTASEAHGFADWLLEQDMRPAYRFYRQQLEGHLAPDPDRRLVVKWPFHLWNLEALFEVFPQAQVVICDRDPKEVVPSSANLALFARAPMVHSVDTARLGRFWYELSATGTRRARRVLAQPAMSKQIKVVTYEKLMASPDSTVRAIAEALQLDGKLFAGGKKAPSHRPTPHHYSLAEFGLDATEIRERVGRLIKP